MTVPLVSVEYDGDRIVWRCPNPECQKEYSMFQGECKTEYRMQHRCTANNGCSASFMVRVPPSLGYDPHVTQLDNPLREIPPTAPVPTPKKRGRPFVYSPEQQEQKTRERQIRKSERRKERRRLERESLEAGVPLLPVQPEPENPLQLHEPGKRVFLSEAERKSRQSERMARYRQRKKAEREANPAPVAPSPLREIPKEIRIDGLPGGISITITLGAAGIPTLS